MIFQYTMGECVFIAVIMFMVGAFIGLVAGKSQPTNTYQLQSTNTIMVEFEAARIRADFTKACAPGWKIVRVSR